VVVAGLDAMGAVCVALDPVCAKWRDIGIILGAKNGFLEELRSSDKSSTECIQSIVKKWLKKKFDAKFGAPSWKKLVEAIGARTGGCNAIHAQEIAQKHLASPENGAKKPCLGIVTCCW